MPADQRAAGGEILPSDLDVGVTLRGTKEERAAQEVKLKACAKAIFEQTGVMIEFTDVKAGATTEEQRLLAGTKTDPGSVQAGKSASAATQPTNESPLVQASGSKTDDAIIKEIAAAGERWTNNKLEGTCATAAMKNTISAQLAGYEAYVIEFDGWNNASPWFTKLGLDPDGTIGRIFAKLGVATKLDVSAHAIAAVKGADGEWRYLSWGRVEGDWEVFAKEVFDGYSMRGTFNTGDHVRWMVDHKWEYKHPTTGKLVSARCSAG